MHALTHRTFACTQANPGTHAHASTHTHAHKRVCPLGTTCRRDRCLHLSHRLTPVLAVIMAPQAVMVAFQLLGGLSPGRSTAQQVACIALFVGPAVSTLFPRSAGARGTAALHLLLMVGGKSGGGGRSVHPGGGAGWWRG